MKKNIGLASHTQHDKGFYSGGMNENQYKQVENYEISNIDYHKFNLDEFRAEYLKNGVHIYDTKMINKHFDGGKSGKLEYKIRKADAPDFNEKLDSIKENIQSKHNLLIKNKSTNYLKSV